MDAGEIRLLKNLPPARQLFCSIGVARGKTIQRYLLDNVYLGLNIAIRNIRIYCG